MAKHQRPLTAFKGQCRQVSAQATASEDMAAAGFLWPNRLSRAL